MYSIKMKSKLLVFQIDITTEYLCICEYNKYLVYKVEKCCLKCDYYLGIVVASIGFFNILSINLWKNTSLLGPIEIAKKSRCCLRYDNLN
ncbi:rifin PIR protein, putative [Plasmodium gaboni]|uniref:Rifin PIR protein, putative n=1 Tax=Plasmodium gaboni TaxID=647221 RepID=A0ABY1UK05_9APIC|nr:rifin PIR protein, putative [Plasmodium gaboni]